MVVRKSVIVLAVAALLAGCGGESGTSAQSPERSPIAPAEEAAPEDASPADYAKTLVSIRGNLGSDWTAQSAMKAAEKLNVAAVPDGYALRHVQLVEDLESLGQRGPVDVSAGADAGKALAAIDNLACELDPTVLSWC